MEPSVTERLEAAMQRQPPGLICAVVGIADRVDQGRRQLGSLGVAGIDPVPGEVPHHDGRNAGSCSGGARDRWDVAYHQIDRVHCEPRRFRIRALVERSVEGMRLGDRCRDVDRQAVQLHHAGVRIDRLEIAGTAKRSVEHPAGRRRPDRHAYIRTPATKGSDDLYLPGCVTEAMPRDVEGNGSHQPSPSRRCAVAAGPPEGAAGIMLSCRCTNASFSTKPMRRNRHPIPVRSAGSEAITRSAGSAGSGRRSRPGGLTPPTARCSRSCGTTW